MCKLKCEAYFWQADEERNNEIGNFELFDDFETMDESVTAFCSEHCNICDAECVCLDKTG